MLSLCGGAHYNIEITRRVFVFLDTKTLCQCKQVSTVWRQFISSYLAQVLSSLPVHREEITKNRLITYAPELFCIYKGKKGQKLQFIPVAEKTGGTALGTIYEKTSGSRWIGKVGSPNGVFRNDPNTIRTRAAKEINSDSMREKIASDLFKELGKGMFAVPKTYLSKQKVVDAFTKNHALAQDWEYLGISQCLRIMSRFVKGYYDFDKAITTDLDQTISFMAYIKKYRRPPETLLTPEGQSVPLNGIMALLAVGRLLADVDLLGGSGGNAGFYWIEEEGVIIGAQTVKIDPGFSFCCSELHTKDLSPNLVINTYHKVGPGQYYLEDIRDLQTSSSNRDTIVYWHALSVPQKEEFLKAFLHGMCYFNSDELLIFLLHRDNLFSRTEKEQFPTEIALKMHQEIKAWAALQQDLYAQDLQSYTLQNSESLIRASYLNLWEAKERFSIKPNQLFVNSQKVLLLGESTELTTFCKQIAHEWSAGGIWDRFHRVYLLSLAKLSEIDLSIETLSLFLKQTPNTLVILDGYQLASPHIKAFVNYLLADPHLHILLTSTPACNELGPLLSDQIELQVLDKNYPDSDLFQLAIQNHFPLLSKPLLKQIALKASLEEYPEHFRILAKHPDEALGKFYLKILEENLEPDIYQTLLEIPNQSGLRLCFKLSFNKLEQALLAITDESPKGGKTVAITTTVSAIPRYLKSSIIERILEGTDIRDIYKGSAHRVCRLEYEGYDLHFKQKPSHPLMEYAIHNLMSRIAGELTPPTLLLRFDVQGKSYPVLMSLTVKGENLKSSWPKLQANANYTWTLLCAILTRPGDGRLSNYILDPQNKLYCIDNDISFVEPVVKEMIFPTVNFCSAPFAILPLNTPLDSEVLQQFCELDSYAILDGWIGDVIQKEQEYTKLFTEQEQKRLYEEDPEKSFTPTILFREGTLATLHLQFWQLQNNIALSLTQDKVLTAGELLQMLISLHQEKIGSYIYKSYNNAQPTPETKLQKATSRNQQQSMTSVQYHQACLGKIPKIQEINQKFYSPENARKEFLFTVLEKNSHYVDFISNAEGTSIQANFQDLENDPSRQLLVLKALIEQAKIQRPHSITIHHSNILEASHLESLLHPSLTSLDLRYCTAIDEDAISVIARFSQLKELLLSGTNITVFQGSFLWSRVIDFPKLTNLRLDHCPNLHTIQVRATQHLSLTAKHNPKLEILRIKKSPFFQVDCTGSPQVQVSYLKLECVRTLKGHADVINSFIQLSDGTLASGSKDKTIKLWDPETGVCKQTLQGHIKAVEALLQLSDGTLVSGSWGGIIKLWDLKTGNCKQTLHEHISLVDTLLQLLDGSLASGSWDGTIKLWDTETGACKQTLKRHAGSAFGLKQLSDGTLVSRSSDKTIKLWDPETGASKQTLQGHTGLVIATVLLSDGTLASGSYDTTIKLWDLETGNCKQTFQGHADEVHALILLSDGTLASGSYDKTIKLWDPETGNCKQTLEGHAGSVFTLKQLTDGTLASGSADRTIKLWDPKTGDCKQTLKGHKDKVYGLVELSDGTLASRSGDGTIKLWQ